MATAITLQASSAPYIQINIPVRMDEDDEPIFIFNGTENDTLPDFVIINGYKYAVNETEVDIQEDSALIDCTYAGKHESGEEWFIVLKDKNES